MRSKWDRILAVILTIVIILQSVEGNVFSICAYAQIYSNDITDGTSEAVIETQTMENEATGDETTEAETIEVETTEAETIEVETTEAESAEDVADAVADEAADTASEELDIPEGTMISYENQVCHGNFTVHDTSFLGEDLVVEGDVYIYSSLQLNNHTLTVQGKLYLYAGELLLDGNLNVQDGTILYGGYIRFGHGCLCCASDIYLIGSAAKISMTDADDIFQIRGNFCISSGFRGTLNMEAGTIELSGDYLEMQNESGVFSGTGMVAGEDFTLCLTGTGSQMIDVQSEDTQISNVQMVGDEVRRLYVPEYNPIQVYNEDICDIYEGIFRLNEGILRSDSNAHSWNGCYYYDIVYLEEPYQMSASSSLRISGSFYQGADFTPNHNFSVNGGYYVQKLEKQGESIIPMPSDGILDMTTYAPEIKIGGDFIMNSSQNHTGKLEAGTLNIAGSFYQYGEGIPNFVPGEKFTVKISSSGNNDVYMQDTENNWITGFSGYASFVNEIPLRGTSIGSITGTIQVRGEDLEKITAVSGCTIHLVSDAVLSSNMFFTNSQELIVDAGLDLNGYSMYCQNLTIPDGSQGRIILNQETSELYVLKDFYTGGLYSCDCITQGTIRFFGDVTQRNLGIPDNFVTGKQVQVVLCASGCIQHLSFDSPESVLYQVEVNNGKDGYVQFLTDVSITNLVNTSYTLIMNMEGITGYTLTQDTVLDGDLCLTSGTMDLNGYTLTVKGNFIIAGGLLTLHGGTLHVEGNLRLQGYTESEEGLNYEQGYGSLQMEAENELLQVDGSIYENCAYTQSWSNGTVLLSGDLVSYAGKLSMTSNSVLVLQGTEAQMICAENNKLCLSELQIRNTVKFTCEGTVLVRDSVEDSGCVKEGALYVGGIGVLGSNYRGDVIIEDDRYNSHNELTKDIIIQGNLEIYDYNRLGKYTLQVDTITIYDAISIGEGTLKAETLNLNSDLWMSYEDGVIDVVNLNICLTEAVTNMKAGTLYIRGNFTEQASTYAFVPSGTHTTILDWTASASETPVVRFSQTKSRFQILQLNTKLSEYDTNRTIHNIAVTVIGNYNDTEAPDMPSSLTITSSNYQTVTLAWEAAVDNDVVYLYEIYQDGTRIAETSNCKYTVTGMTQNESHLYKIYAVDLSWNRSVPAAISASTKEDVQAPTDVQNFQADASFDGSSVPLRWKASTDDGLLDHYNLYRNDELLAEITQTSYTDATVAEGNTYTYAIEAVDWAGNQSAQRTLTVTPVNPPDAVELYVTSEQGTITMSFTSDNRNVSYYSLSVYQDGDYVDSHRMAASDAQEYSYTFTIGGERKLYTCYVTAYSSQGQSAGVVKTIYMHPDTQAPELLSVTGLNDIGIVNESTKITVTASDNCGVKDICMQYAEEGSDEWTTLTGTFSTSVSGVSTKQVTWNPDGLYGYYILRITAIDTNGNQIEEEYQTAVNCAGLDGVTIYEQEAQLTSMQISWDCSCEDEVSYYMLECMENNRIAASVKTDTQTAVLQGLLPDTEYTVRVIPYSAEGQRGLPSESVMVRTLYDVEVPVVQKLTPTNTYVSSNLTLKIQVTDNAAMEKYEIYSSRNQETWELQKTYTFHASGTTFTYTYSQSVSALDEGEYYIKVLAYDTCGNVSEEAVQQYIVDHTPTEAPTELTASLADGKAVLSWRKPADEDVVSYNLYRSMDGNSSVLCTTSSTTGVSTSIKKGHTYSFYVTAVDRAGNISEPSDVYQVDTSEDITAPTAPERLMCDGRTGSSIYLKWSASTDDIEVDSYQVYRNGVLVATTDDVMYQDSGLSVGRFYTYTITAIDWNGNESAMSEELTASTVVTKIEAVTPENYSTLGGDRVTIGFQWTKYVTNGDYQVTVEYSANGSDWTTIEGKSPVSGTVIQDSRILEIDHLADGEYQIRIRITDPDGNESSFLRFYYVDRQSAEPVKQLLAEEEQRVVSLVWDKSISEDLYGYYLYRRSAEPNSDDIDNETWEEVAQLGKSVTFYQDSDVTEEHCYQYGIVAYDSYMQESIMTVSDWIQVSPDDIAPEVVSVQPVNQVLSQTVTLTVLGQDNRSATWVSCGYYDAYASQWVSIGEGGMTDGKAELIWDTSLLHGRYKIRAVIWDAAGNESEAYEQYYDIDNVGIDKIQNFQGTAYMNCVVLTWDAVSEDDFQYFSIEQLMGEEYVQIGTETSVLGFQVGDLEPETEYTFQVVGYDEAGNRGEPSDSITITTGADVMLPVIEYIENAATETTVNPSELMLRVRAVDNIGLKSIQIEYSMDEETWTILDVKDNIDKVSYIHTCTLQTTEIPEGTVYVRAIATDQYGNQNDSNQLVAEFAIDHTPPEQVTGLKWEEEAGIPVLTWNPVADADVMNYHVVLSDGVNTEEISCKSLYYEHYNSTSGATYTYQVYATDIYGNKGPVSEPVIGICSDDTIAPQILSLMPLKDTCVSGSVELSVMVKDNVAVQKLFLYYRSTEDSGQDYLIQELTINGNGTKTCKWDTTGLDDGIYQVRIQAVDAAGNQSDWYITEYVIDNTAPERGVLLGMSGNYCCSLSWETRTLCSETVTYELYRKSSGETAYRRIYQGTDTSYTDENLDPSLEYAYVLRTLDAAGNYADSYVTYLTPYDIDDIAPVAYVTADSVTVEGYEIVLDGIQSTDNCHLASFSWDFGDGTTGSGAKTKHIYETAGTYTATLTVTDKSGNTDTDTAQIKVLKRGVTGSLTLTIADASGNLLSGASVYAHTGESDNDLFLTDEQGQCRIVAEPGTYQIAVFKNGYIAKEITITVHLYEEASDTVILESGSLVSGDLTVRKLTFEEMVDAGIDITAPENQHVFVVESTFIFEERERSVIYINNSGEMISASGGTSGGSGDGGSAPVWGITYNRTDTADTTILPEELPEETPSVVMLSVTQEISWLMEMYEAKLTIYNHAASPSMYFDDNEAELILPRGISLAKTREPQYVSQSMEIIRGGQNGQAVWYLKGDTPGTYTISASYHGTFQPFGLPASAEFNSNEFKVSAGEGLVLYIRPEITAEYGDEYYVYFVLRNEGTTEFYNIKTTFGTAASRRYYKVDASNNSALPLMSNGDYIAVPCLAPGEEIRGYYTSTFHGDAYRDDKYVYYLQLVQTEVNVLTGADLGVKVVVDPVASHLNIPTTIYQTVDPDQTVADPIDTWSGAYIHDETLLSMGEDGDFNICMQYNSRYTSECGEFGYGWVHNYESRLVDMQDGTLRFYPSPNAYYTFQMDNLEEQEPWSIDEDGYYVLDPSKLEARQTYTCYSDNSFDLQRLEDFSYVMTDDEGTTYTFSQDGSLTGITSLQGRSITIERTTEQVTITDVLSGRSFTLYLNDRGLAEQVTDSAGRSLHLYYDNENQLTIMENALGERTYYTYDSSHRILTAAYPDGTVYMTNTYDNEGRVLTQDDGLGDTPLTFLSYSEDESTGHTKTTVTNRLGGTAVSEYDASGNLLSATNEKGETIQYTYDADGNNTMITDAGGNKQQCEYDEHGNLIRVTQTGGTVICLSYDEENRLISSSNSNGESVSFQYDNQGRIVRTIDQNGNWTRYSYNAYGMVLTETSEVGTTSYEYSGADIVSVTQPGGYTVYNTYDAAGHILSVSDQYGTIENCTYDALGRVQTKTNASGGITAYTYDTCGNLRTVTAPDGGVTIYEYNKIGWTERITDAEGGYMEYSVNSEGWITAVTDSLGRTTGYEYDAVGNLTAEIDAEGNRTEYTYDSGGNVLTVTNPQGTVTTYSYYPNGKLAKAVEADGTAVYYTYEQNWRISNMTSDSGEAVSYEYDAVGNLTAEIDALGNKTSYTYDIQGNILTITDPMGNITGYTYDAAGNILSIRDALGNVTGYTYDGRGRLTAITLADGSVTELRYDAANNIIQTIDPVGNTISYSYDNQNNCIQINDGYDMIVEETTYDLLGRAVTVADALGNLTYTTYDTEGQITGMTKTGGEEEQSAVYAYDSLGRITQTTDSMDAPVGITYDEVGNLTSITDAQGQTTTYQYDSRNNLIKEENAIGAVSRYSYNAMNLLEEEENANGDITTYEYDALGRITAKTDDIGTIHYTYDKNSNLLTVEENGATIVRTYDALNRVTSYTDYAGRTIQYGYDEVGNLITLTYAGGEIIRYEYNPDGSLYAVTDSEGRRTEYSYNKNSQTASIHRPDGSTEVYTYDEAGRRTGQTDIASDGTILQSLSYTYDGYGNIIAKSGYDTHLDTSVLTDTSMEYDEANRLVRYNGKTVKYDRNGNMIYGPLDGVMTTYTYDCRNRLIKAGSTTYTYDAEDNRIASTTDGITTEYLIDSQSVYSQVVEEYQNSQVTRTYVYGNASLLYEETGNDTRYHHYDNLGSTTVLTGQDGDILATYSYDTYGKLLSGNTELTSYLYNGSYGVQTDRNGLYYMRARYYNTDISRFINQDILRGTPDASQSLNRYAYCQGNPVNQADPFGLCPQEMTGRQWAHLGLSIVGSIPVVGIAANMIDAVLYFQEGDALSGMLCLAGAAIGAGGILSAAKGASCLVRTTGMALKTAGIAYTASSMAVLTIEGVARTYSILEANDFQWNTEALISAGETAAAAIGTVSGFKGLGDCIHEAASLSARGMACFTAGTQVLTREGYKNIEDIRPGDYVYATDEETGESGYKEVLQVFEKETEVITHVCYEDADGRTQEIETTLNHPFWCEGEWRAAGTLKEGEQLTLADGTQVAITDVTFEDRHTTVYNMEVADYHTYYVGKDSVWVHNQCGSGGQTTDGFEEWLNKGKSDNTVYFALDETRENYVYTGITRQSLSRRLYQHRRNGKKYVRLDAQYDNLTRNQARALEQYFINHGPNRDNKINSIGKSCKYRDAAEAWAEWYIGGRK